jgi:hypothetical protein
MKYRRGFVKGFMLIIVLLGLCVCAPAQENTEVYGFFESYRNFDYKTGFDPADFQDVNLNGGGGGIAYNFVPWFALWTQVSFLGSPENDQLSVRIINNLQGVRYQSPKYGPFIFYGKGGLGFTNYGLTFKDSGAGYGSTKFSAGYGGGIQIWVNDYLGLVLEASHLLMGVPQVTDSENRDKWDSGLTYKTGLAIRF